ncbi:hypothetical protein V8D89_012687 [Ganoderma adspersum]
MNLNAIELEEEEEPATSMGDAMIESFREHVPVDLYGHRLRPDYAMYRGPLILRTRVARGCLLDEHGVSLLFSRRRDRDSNTIRGFQT